MCKCRALIKSETFTEQTSIFDYLLARQMSKSGWILGVKVQVRDHFSGVEVLISDLLVHTDGRNAKALDDDFEVII